MIKVKIPAKINLNLDVMGKDGGYHLLDSLVASISVFNKGVFYKRNDKIINITFKGEPLYCNTVDSNAYKVAKEFIEKYNTYGADIVIKRNIKTGAGLGGSSSDIACVLKGLQSLYNIKEDLSKLANKYGSDCAYMLNGGYCRMQGRGEKLTQINCDKIFYFNVLLEKEGVSTKQCFDIVDNEKLKKPTTEKAINYLQKGKTAEFINLLKNDLTNASVKLLPAIQQNLKELEKYGKAFMTGSGSATLGIYDNKKSQSKAYKELKKAYGKNVIKAKIVL
ncbi:MAG: hypothetical protein MJ066_00690 [Clostridia bacterium]|nr:hypothetical protein [Clostridia bacterium]